jgi:iron complex outermembrane receptor protein
MKENDLKIREQKILSLTKIFFIFFVISLQCSFAQTVKNDSLKLYNIKEIVVTGTRAKTDINKIPQSITVINQKEINQSNDINILPVLSNQVPGLFIDEKNIAGFGVSQVSGGNINIRGIGGNPNSNILVLIDGQPQFMGLFGHPIVDALNSSDIQRVEIIRGASSILYGTNALGGAINIITKQPSLNKLDFNFLSFYGSYNTFGVNGSIGYRNNLFGIFTSINNLNTNGSRTDAQDGFYTTAGYLKITLTPKGVFSFIADGDLSNSKFYDPGTIFSPTINNYYKYLRTRGSFSIMNNLKDVDGALRFFYSYGNHNFFNGWRSYDEMKGITFYQNFNYLKNNIFTFGVDYKNYGGNGNQPGLPSFVSKGLGVYHSADERALYGLLNYSPVKPLNIEAGLRYTNNSLFGDDVTPDFGITYSLSNSATLKGTISKAFRSPTINELYLFPTANPNLKAEHVWNYEISFDKRIINYFDFTVTAYYDKGDNFIVVVPPFSTNMNLGKFIHKGIEFSGKYIVSSDFNFMLNYAFLNCDVPTLYAPKQKIILDLSYNYEALELNADLQQVFGLYTSLQNSITENYFTLDVSAGYLLVSNLNIYVKGKNLLNKNYFIDYGYPMPGRNVMLGIKLNF